MKNIVFDASFFRQALNPNKNALALIVTGLGNPVPQYEYTRHNAGKYVCKRMEETKKLGPYKEVNLKNADLRMYQNHAGLIFAEPKTYMNLSALATQDVNRWYTYHCLHMFDQSKFFLVHDDLELDPGKVQFRYQCRSTRGHNGLKSIIELSHGTVKFPRLRLGIGRPRSHDRDDVAHYVLSRFTDEELKVLDNDIVPMCGDILDVILTGDGILAKEERLLDAWEKIFKSASGKLVRD